MLNYLDTILEEIKEAKEAEVSFGKEFGPYMLLIDYGKSLLPLPKEHKTEKNLVTKCRSTVYIIGGRDGDHINYYGDSDSVFVKGELAVLLKTLSGLTPEEIISKQAQEKLEKFMDEAKTYLPLSTSRSEGFFGMYEKMREIANGLLN
mgnify:CR=1 FL=1